MYRIRHRLHHTRLIEYRSPRQATAWEGLGGLK